MKGRGISRGALTVINAMACGIGCTIGTELYTEAVFDTDAKGKNITILNDPSEDTSLARICVESAFAFAGKEEPEDWSLVTYSDIPPSKGLKSSSSACNAIISAVFDAIGYEAEDMSVVKLGVECARKAGVTVTGAFDDACGCHFGGIIMTDNAKDSVIFADDIEDMDVIIYVPDRKIRKSSLPMDKIASISNDMEKITESAKTDYLNALTQNGKIYSAALGLDDSFAEACLKNGALAAGLSGSGPAIVALTKKGEGLTVAAKTGYDDIILTRTRHRI